MASSTGRRELGRGERVLPGVWRLRLPLPWPGIPHCNAWAVAAGHGVVLFDCGMHEPGSLAHLERALEQVHLRLEHVRLLVCTHAHADHFGQAATVIERAGCELWMHPDHTHMADAARDPAAALEHRLEVARQSGVPDDALGELATLERVWGSGLAAAVEPDRPLLPGVEVMTDLGPWLVIETPGHAPSHVCLFQPERRLLISGDHLLGRVSLYYEHGYSPDPVGEFLSSLDAVEAFGPRLCLPGHGRTFADVGAHIDANRGIVAERLERVEDALAEHGPLTAFEAVPRLHAEPPTAAVAWWLSETLCYLRHLEMAGRASAERDDPVAPERWSAAG
jgi:glyoxylase-like metal-dependent hydrolase (beta-lactamase superfamily II)